ncbi:hypothetical protein Aduo_019023 [Ancylostoma duodenale]
MTELAAFKTRISLACRTINALQTKVQTLDQPFEFPTTATKCTIFIAEKMAEIDEVKLSLSVLLENLKSQIDVAMTNTMARKEQSERERLINDLDAFLNIEANETEIIAIQWTGRLNYRIQELEKQSSIIQARPTTSGTTSARDTDTDSTVSSVYISHTSRIKCGCHNWKRPCFLGVTKTTQHFGQSTTHSSTATHNLPTRISSFSYGKL